MNPARRRGPRHVRDRRADRRALLMRVGGLALAAASAGGLLVISLPVQSEAAAPVDSSMTVSWAGDTGAAKDYQPTRSTTSVHYADFQNLSVTVSQTEDVGDQAVRVTVTGLAQTRATEDGTGRLWTAAQNFMQAMQCWGDPASPDFRQTCAWGGRALVANNGLGDSVYRDNVLRVSERDLLPTVADGVDVPFVRAIGSTITGRQVTGSGGLLEYPLFGVLGPSTTNEVQAARIGSGASSSFDFETQSATVSPSLGCGSSSANERCWLVLVPRGTHFGGSDDHCSYILDADLQQYSYGRSNSIQAGSPVNPACDYWDNRMVIPLDFKPVATSCPQSTASRALIGSQLMLAAITSWQLDLCTRLGVAYTFASNPDSVARLQLLDGQAGLAFGSFPIVKSELGDEVAEGEFDKTAVSYAPVAIGAAAIAFYAEGPDGRIDDLHLTPRLMAKLLTQSYTFTVPKNAEAPDKNVAHLPQQNRRYEYFWQDPDFQNANPNYQRFIANPSIVLPGPAGADAIRQVWRWILADDDARAWLAGGDDGYGMTVNPYYLPAGNAAAKVPTFDANGDYVYVAGTQTKVTRDVGLRNADGTPMKIGEQTLDRFLKVDESEVPLKITLPNQTPFGTLQAFPYVLNFSEAALKAFRADPAAKTVWDPTKKNASGGDGDWVSSGAQLPGSRFMIAITDLASADRYALDTAQLRLPNSGIYGTADDEGMAAALTYLAATAVPSFRQVDPAQVVSGYPLTTVVYAAVNLTGSNAAARKDFASFLKSAVGPGQQPGAGIGDLPAGYLPLTSEMVSQTTAAAAAVESYVAPTPRPSASTSPNGYAMDPYDEGFLGEGDGSGVDDPQAEITPGVDDGADTRTPVASVQPIGQAGLALSLGAGLAGALFAPFLFRRRGLL